MTEQEFQARCKNPQPNDIAYNGGLLDVKISDNCHEYYYWDDFKGEVACLRLEGNDKEDFIPIQVGAHVAYTYGVSSKGVTWAQ